MADNDHTNWHYPRTELANKILKSFETGLADRFTIFAPRKRGKTEFVQRDVSPMAKKRGILVVYVDFWRNKSSPTAAFASAVMAARRDQENWFSTLLNNSTLKAKVKLFGGDLSLEVSPQRKHAEKEVLDAAFEELESSRKPVLLLLEEVQHLATDPAFSDFTATLRSFMTARSDNKIKGIFTGSSEEGLAQLFKRTKAPFYSASATLAFPDLGEDFVAFELEVFKQVTGGVCLDPVLANTVFGAMSHAPGLFTDLLKRMALESVHDLTTGVSLFSESLIEEENQQYQLLFDDLHPLDKAILIMISRGECRRLYREDFKAQLKALCPTIDNLNKSSIQNAVTRLKGSNINAIYSIEHGTWRFADPAFEQFVRSQNSLVPGDHPQDLNN